MAAEDKDVLGVWVWMYKLHAYIEYVEYTMHRFLIFVEIPFPVFACH